jgi:2-oxoisovalerate dehydrogenase E1 component alpha subunit
LKSQGPITNHLKLIDPLKNSVWPMFQLMTADGELSPENEESMKTKPSQELCRNMYTQMVRLQTLDDVLYNAQRQGRISFYMQSSGEEGDLVTRVTTCRYNLIYIALIFKASPWAQHPR